MSDWNELTAPDATEIEAMARAALATLPAEFGGPAQDVAIRVAEFAPDEGLDEL